AIPDEQASDNSTDDPLFVQGRLGNFYLSAGAAGQVLDANGTVGDGNSPAINAGSATAASLGMNAYSTRTDTVVDGGTVDIGFHYNDLQDVATYALTITRTPTAGGTVTPASGTTYTQFSQVRLKATPANTYQLKSWSGTDNDAAVDANGNVDANNIVTMSDDKTVVVTFQTTLVKLRASVVGGSGTIDPARERSYARGTVVTLTATPTDLSHIIRWSGTDNDNSIDRTNTATINGPYARFVNGTQVVNVTFQAPRTLHVPGDYTNIQRAIDDANSGDIVMISPGRYNITPSGDDENGAGIRVDGKNLTISSANPDDPCVAAATILTGGWMEFSNVDRNCLVSGITIQDSRWYTWTGCAGGDTACGNPLADGMNGGSWGGGAVQLVGDASPTFRNCIIKDNELLGGYGGNAACPGGDGGWGGYSHGGGVNVGIDGNPLFVNCLFQNCIARGGDGGNGCLSDPGGHGGSWGAEDDPRWDYGPYEPYWKYSGYGGAVYCETGSTPEFVDCDFVD
ncbi:MAG: hypothetical protein Q7T25_16430, partial [Sideroxyarcus sp.]|nr:hypothetical protein [Sideroxyarcus sp.]